MPVTVTVTLMAAAAAAARLRPGPSRAHWRPLSASASVPPARDSMTTAKTGIVHTMILDLDWSASGFGQDSRSGPECTCLEFDGFEQFFQCCQSRTRGK